MDSFLENIAALQSATNEDEYNDALKKFNEVIYGDERYKSISDRLQIKWDSVRGSVINGKNAGFLFDALVSGKNLSHYFEGNEEAFLNTQWKPTFVFRDMFKQQLDDIHSINSEFAVSTMEELNDVNRLRLSNIIKELMFTPGSNKGIFVDLNPDIKQGLKEFSGIYITDDRYVIKLLNLSKPPSEEIPNSIMLDIKQMLKNVNPLLPEKYFYSEIAYDFTANITDPSYFRLNGIRNNDKWKYMIRIPENPFIVQYLAQLLRKDVVIKHMVMSPREVLDYNKDFEEYKKKFSKLILAGEDKIQLTDFITDPPPIKATKIDKDDLSNNIIIFTYIFFILTSVILLIYIIFGRQKSKEQSYSIPPARELVVNKIIK